MYLLKHVHFYGCCIMSCLLSVLHNFDGLRVNWNKAFERETIL